MKAFDPNYKLLDEMYQDDYYPASLVDKVCLLYTSRMQMGGSPVTTKHGQRPFLCRRIVLLPNNVQTVSYTHLRRKGTGTR